MLKLKKVNLYLLSWILILLLFGFSINIFAYNPKVNYDLEGETITFLSWGDMKPDEGTPEYSRLIESQKNNNYEMEYTSINHQELLEKVMAGVMSNNPPGDIIRMLSDRHYTQLALEGALYPLEEFLGEDFYNSLPAPVQGEEGFKNMMSIQGKCYAIPWTGTPFVTTPVIVWNKDLFAEEDLPNLYELLENGNWTWEKLREIAIKATKDTDGDGKIDQWGLWSLNPDMNLIATNNVYPTKKVDGKVKFDLTNSKSLYVLNMIQKLINDDEVVLSWNAGGEPFTNGKVAMQVMLFWKTKLLDKEKVNYGMTLLPKGPEADKNIIPISHLPVVGIPATAENPKQLIDVYNSIYYYKFKGEDLEETAAGQPDRESYDLVFKMSESWELITPWKGIFNQNGLSQAFWQILQGNKTPANAMKEIEPKMQAVLDDLLAQ